ncbi:MAG: substrate-binding domain-containing protein [Eubacteriales bacterium]|nr:substrate-binding domain-containing protein [Eubacteriales bacterium]
MKRNEKWIVLVLVCLVLFGTAILLLQQRSPKKMKEANFIYIPKTEDGTNEFWTALIAGTRMAAKEYGINLKVESPKREQDIEQQEKILQNAITEKPDAILISPSSYTRSTQMLKEAKAEGIPIVFIDSYIEEKVQDLTVSTDNVAAGRKLGEYADGLLKENEKIAVVGHVKGVSTAMERERGFVEGLGEKAGSVVEIVYCNSEYDKAYQLTMELLEKYPDLKMIAGLNEYSFVGAARAVRDAAAQNHVMIVGIDSSQEAVDMMEQGIIKGIVVQKAFKMGYIGVQETYKMLCGKTVPEQVDSGCELVTPENIYDSEIEKLIFPFSE